MSSLGILDSIKDYKNQIKKFTRYSEKEFKKLIENYWLLCLYELAPHAIVFEKPPVGLTIGSPCTIPFEVQTSVVRKKKVVKKVYQYNLDHHVNSFPCGDIQHKILSVTSSKESLMREVKKLSHMVYGTNRSILYGEVDQQGVILKFEKMALLFHEFLLGKHVVNSLRSTLPTFVWTYGLKPMTGFPFFIQGYPNFDLCSNLDPQELHLGDYRKDSQMLMLLEHVPGENLASHISTIDLDDLCLVMIHIFLSLNVAYNKHEFVHWDLHSENVILRKIDESCSYPLDHNCSLGHMIVHEYLPVIFDYGLSSAKNPSFTGGNYFVNKFFGEEKKIELDYFRNFECIRTGLNPYWSNPWIDIIRLFASVIMDADVCDREDIKEFLLDFVCQTFFCGHKDAKDAFKELENNYCFLPENDFMKQMTFDNFFSQFLEHIHQVIPDFEYTCPHPFGPTITCETYPEKTKSSGYDIFDDLDGLLNHLNNQKEYFLDYLLRGYVQAKLNGVEPINLKETLKKNYKYDTIIKKTKQFLKSQEDGVDLTLLLAEFVKKSYIVQPEEDEEEFMENFYSLFYD
jgi:hypothetical protein